MEALIYPISSDLSIGTTGGLVYREQEEKLIHQLAQPLPPRLKVVKLLQLSSLLSTRDHRLAREYAVQAVESARNQNNRCGHGKALVQLAYILNIDLEHDMAMRCLNEALPLLNGSKNRQERARAWFVFAQIYFFQGDLPTAKACLQKAFIIYEKSDPYSTADCNLLLASISCFDGNNSHALALCEGCLKTYRMKKSISNLAGIRKTYMSLTTVYLYARQFEKVEECLAQAEVAALEAGDIEGEALGMLVRANVYLERGQVDKAAESAKKSYSLAKQHVFTKIELLSALNLANCYVELANYQYALKVAQEICRISKHVSHQYFYSQAVRIVGHSQLKLGHVKEAIETLESVLHAHVYLFPGLKSDLYENLMEACAAEKSYEKAFHYASLHTKARVELEEFRHSRQMQFLEVQIQLERFEKEQEILKFKADQLEIEIQQKTSEVSDLILHTIKQKKFLAHLKQKMRQLPVEGQNAKAQLRNLIKEIDQTVNAEQDWKPLEIKLYQLYENFNKKLLQCSNGLTPSEVKVCMLLRLNLSTKDIASFLHTTTRTIETHRLHIRKKLNLASGISLLQFLGSL